MASPILYSFVNTSLAESYGERGLVISSMMTLGFTCQIWVPLFTFPTVQAPRFPNGYPAATVFLVTMWGLFVGGVWYMRRWNRQRQDEETSLGGGSSGEATEEKELDVDGSGSSTPVQTTFLEKDTKLGNSSR